VATQMYRHLAVRVRMHGANPPLTHRLHSAVFDRANKPIKMRVYSCDVTTMSRNDKIGIYAQDMLINHMKFGNVQILWNSSKKTKTKLHGSSP
jgi:hypothetical protein